MGNYTRLSPVESAKLLRAALRRAFPGTKFSVRLSRGTAWGNAHVAWTDGPKPRDVEALCAGFESEGFDGMTDSTTRREAVVDLPDGSRARSGIGLILTNRDLSEGERARLQREVAARFPDSRFDYWSPVRALAHEVAADEAPTDAQVHDLLRLYPYLQPGS